MRIRPAPLIARLTPAPEAQKALQIGPFIGSGISRTSYICPDALATTPAVTPFDANTQLWSVSEAMVKLPEEQRLAVALVLVEGLSYKEAAELLDIPIGTLTSRLARGRTALAAALGEPT